MRMIKRQKLNDYFLMPACRNQLIINRNKIIFINPNQVIIYIVSIFEDKKVLDNAQATKYCRKPLQILIII